MKKYIIPTLSAILALMFSACSNEDIRIDRQFSITVDASGIPAAYKNIEAGDGVNGIRTLEGGYRLRVRTIVYNTEGKAVVNTQEYRDDYGAAGTPISAELENGDYTFVVITDVIQSSSRKEFWMLTEANDINKATLTYNSSSNAYKYGILGVQCKQVKITNDTQNITMKPTPAGALVRVMFTGMKTSSERGYRAFALRTNYTPATIDFKDGKIETTSEQSAMTASGDITRNGLAFDTYTTEAENDRHIGGYLFFLPCEINMRFAYITQSGTSGWCGSVLTGFLEAGVGYDATLDVAASTSVDANTKTTFSVPSSGRHTAPTNTLRLSDIK